MDTPPPHTTLDVAGASGTSARIAVLVNGEVTDVGTWLPLVDGHIADVAKSNAHKYSSSSLPSVFVERADKDNLSCEFGGGVYQAGSRAGPLGVIARPAVVAIPAVQLPQRSQRFTGSVNHLRYRLRITGRPFQVGPPRCFRYWVSAHLHLSRPANTSLGNCFQSAVTGGTTGHQINIPMSVAPDTDVQLIIVQFVVPRRAHQRRFFR